MALINLDLELLQRCLQHKPGSWNDFVDRYLGLIYHTIHHSAHLRSHPLRPDDAEDIAAEVLLQIVANDYAVLRKFKANSSLATYLTVIARRTCVTELIKRAAALQAGAAKVPVERELEDRPRRKTGIEQVEEVEKLLRKLPPKEREIVRLFYLEGRSYEEISTTLQIPVASIGPALSRARKQLKGDDGPAPPKRTRPSVAGPASGAIPIAQPSPAASQKVRRAPPPTDAGGSA